MIFRTLVTKWILLTVAITSLPYFVSGVRVQSFWSAIWAAALLGLLNVIVRPILIVLTLPLTVFSFGFFLLFINAFLLNFVGHVVQGFYVESLGSAFFGAIVVSLSTMVLQNLFFKDTQTATKFGSNSVHYSNRDPQQHSKDQVIDLEEDRDGKWR